MLQISHTHCVTEPLTNEHGDKFSNMRQVCDGYCVCVLQNAQEYLINQMHCLSDRISNLLTNDQMVIILTANRSHGDKISSQ